MEEPIRVQSWAQAGLTQVLPQYIQPPPNIDPTDHHPQPTFPSSTYSDLTRPATTQFRPQSDKPAETGAPSMLPIMAYPPPYSSSSASEKLSSHLEKPQTLAPLLISNQNWQGRNNGRRVAAAPPIDNPRPHFLLHPCQAHRHSHLLQGRQS
ncbi:hypothetical protein EV1_027076 [Malus domestica]